MIIVLMNIYFQSFFSVTQSTTICNVNIEVTKKVEGGGYFRVDKPDFQTS